MSKNKVVELPATQNPTEKVPAPVVAAPAPVQYVQVILNRTEAIQLLTDFLKLALDPKIENFAIRTPKDRIIPEDK